MQPKPAAAVAEFSPALVEEIRSWCFDRALPVWADRGVDRAHGGPVETLTMDGARPSGEAFKRLRVTCRQLYVYSHAELLGWDGARDVADHMYRYLDEAWIKAGNSWPRTLDAATGGPLDATADLYDYAFALFAMGWRYKATADGAALKLAHATLDQVEQRFRHPEGGFHHELPPSLPRQQNPHMHLIEAMLVLAEASGEARFASIADEISLLFKTKLARLPEGVLPEFFDERWVPVPGDQGRRVEPGHQFEWAWILAQHQKLTGTDNAEIVSALVDYAETHGVDPDTGVTFNAVRDDGLPTDRGSRTWPNTERVKGWLGLYELVGADPRGAVASSARLLLERYLGQAPEGCWIDAFDESGRPTAKTIPTSTLYHVLLAFAEIMRLAPRLQSGA